MNLAVTWARRELRSGVAGFRIFLACLALGVAAIAAAGSTAEAFRRGLAAESREILGGDLAISHQGRRFTEEDVAAFKRMGRTTDTIRVRAMAEAPSGERRLAEVRGVDDAYPLAGAVVVTGAPDLATAIVGNGAAVEQAMLDRLRLQIGDSFLIGDTTFVVRAVLTEEPDRLGTGFALGPRVLISLAALDAARLAENDSLFNQTIRVALPPDADLEAAKMAAEAVGEHGPRVRDRTNAAAGLGRLVDRLEYFLAFIGVASLVAGGLGVSGAVGSYLESRKASIAVLKSLGAEGPLIRNVFLLQIGVLSLIGIAIGLLIGAACPPLLGRLVQDQLPIPALFGVYPVPLFKAAAFGLLAAAAFSLAPLARARATPPSALFRKDLTGRLTLGPETIGAGLASLGLVVLTIFTAPNLSVAASLVGGVAAGFLILWGLGRGAAWSAGRLRRFTRGSARIGLANLAGPSSAAHTAVPAIGLGVALLSAIVLVQSTLLAQVREVAPEAAPALVFTQIPDDRGPEFDRLVAQAVGEITPDRYRRDPMASGRIVALKGQPIDIEKITDERWAFDRDITLSAIANEPPNAELAAGQWWAPDYAGPPLAVLEDEVAAGGGLEIGDMITVSVLGRELEVRLAAFRPVEFGEFGPGFSLILNPKALEGAALANVALLKATPEQERVLLRTIARDFPQVNVISVREQLEAAGKIFDQLSWAVRGAAAVAGLAGLLVLAGAIAATARARAREAAMLKVLGSTRGQVLAAYGWEYGGVGLIAALTGVLLGAAFTYPIITGVFEAEWAVDWAGLVAILVGVSALTMAGGLLAAYVALSHRPHATLRAD